MTHSNPKILNRFNNTVLYEGTHGMTLRGTLEKATSVSVNLRYANLSGADLPDANLSGADLYGANLSGADLYGANLSGADLSGANLYGADLRDADLYGANLSGANLSGADLRYANLSGADLSGADLGETLGKLKSKHPFFQCGPIGSRSDYLHAFLTDKGVVIKAGCFTGFITDFVLAVEETHGDNNHSKEYALAVVMIQGYFKLWDTEE
jgi:hypothetical protein